MRSIIKEFIPPILLKTFSKKAASGRHRVFKDYYEALSHCTANAYEEAELIEVILKKTKRFAA